MKTTLTLPSTGNEPAGLAIAGELDQSALTHDYWGELNASDRVKLASVGHLRVDLANVARADTAGLAWLINLVRDAKANKVKVSFLNVPDKLLNLATLSSADGILLQ